MGAVKDDGPGVDGPRPRSRRGSSDGAWMALDAGRKLARMGSCARDRGDRLSFGRQGPSEHAPTPTLSEDPCGGDSRPTADFSPASHPSVAASAVSHSNGHLTESGSVLPSWWGSDSW